MEATAGNLEIKLTQLGMNLEKTDSVIESNNLEAIERYRDSQDHLSQRDTTRDSR